jgi:hypothetical protein
MTQAFNLSQLANNINTSGQLDATDGLTGAVPLANGGTGTTNTVNSIVAGTGISTSVSGTQVTINSTVTGGVTSLNGQQGAITNTDLNAIGSVVFAAYYGTSFILTGTTVAGSSLYYPNTVNTTVSAGGQLYTQYSDGSNFTSFQIPAVLRYSGGNVGVLPPLGASTLSGTWRCMGWALRRESNYNSCSAITLNQTYNSLYIRVS